MMNRYHTRSENMSNEHVCDFGKDNTSTSAYAKADSKSCTQSIPLNTYLTACVLMPRQYYLKIYMDINFLCFDDCRFRMY